jgi:hypothetical protein
MTQRQFRRIHFSFTMMHFPSKRTGHHAPFRAESRVQLQPNPATGVLPVAVRYPEFALCLHFSHTPFLYRRGKTSVPQITVKDVSPNHIFLASGLTGKKSQRETVVVLVCTESLHSLYFSGMEPRERNIGVGSGRSPRLPSRVFSLIKPYR